MARHGYLFAALIVGLAYSSPAWGRDASSVQTRETSDEGDYDARTARERKRPAAPPKMTVGEHDAADEDLESNPCSGTALDVTQSLAIALKDMKSFRQRRERQQQKFPDVPGQEMLNKVVVPAERELVRGYNGLVEKGLVPLAGAGVFVDRAIADLQTVAEQGGQWMKDIDDVTQALEAIVASFDAATLRGGEQSADLSNLQAHEQDLPQLKERLKAIKDEVCRADVLVRAAAEGPRLGLQHAAKARELAAEADRRDSEAISRTTEGRSYGSRKSMEEAEQADCPSGNCPSRRSAKTAACLSGNCSKRSSAADLDSIEGRSGPVIAGAAEKLEVASEKTEAARKETDLVSNPTRGKIMRAVLALDKAADLAISAGGNGPSGGAKGGQGGGGCSSCAGGCSSAGQSMGKLRDEYPGASAARQAEIRAEAAAIVAERKRDIEGVKDEVKAAQNAADKAKGKLADAAQSWDNIVQDKLGARDQDSVKSKLPAIPEPNANVKAAKKGQASWDATSKPRTQSRSEQLDPESEDAEGVAPKSKEKDANPEPEEDPTLKGEFRPAKPGNSERLEGVNMDADQQFRHLIRKGYGKPKAPPAPQDPGQ